MLGNTNNPCGAVTYIQQDPYSDNLQEPSACAADDEVGGCGRKRGEIQFTLLNKPDSRHITYQMVQVQDMDLTRSPKTINVELRGSLCGEVIEVFVIDGILMSRPIGRESRP